MPLVCLTIRIYIHSCSQTLTSEDFPKGSNDRPLQDVVIADSGEVRKILQDFVLLNLSSVQQLEIVHETDADGHQVPLRAEL